MNLHELRVELLAICAEAENRAELIGALEELLKRAKEPANSPQGATVAAIVHEVA